MHTVIRPLREIERLKAIDDAGILKRVIPYQVEFILKALRREFKVSATFVSVVGARVKHILAFSGFSPGVVERDHSFCAHTILQDNPIVIEDTTKDDRVCDNPSVVQAPHIRFYAGVPLRTLSGHNLGAVALIDDTPRAFSSAEQTRLQDVTEAIAIKLGLQDDAMDLSRFAIEDLGRLIRLESERDNHKRLVALIEEFYARFDRHG